MKYYGVCVAELSNKDGIEGVFDDVYPYDVPDMPTRMLSLHGTNRSVLVPDDRNSRDLSRHRNDSAAP